MLFNYTKIFFNNNIVIGKAIISNNYIDENYTHFPSDENNVTITNNLNGSNFIYAKYFFLLISG